jgi:hypothetical protein
MTKKITQTSAPRPPQSQQLSSSATGSAPTSSAPALLPVPPLVKRPKKEKKEKSLAPLSKAEQMRLRYGNTYNEYMIVFQKLVMQKNKFNAALRRVDEESSDSSGDTDADAERELMSPEELKQLRKKHNELYEELTELKQSYSSLS